MDVKVVIMIFCFKSIEIMDAMKKKIDFSYMTEMPPIGECDIKFTRWYQLYGDLIAHSVDGDFLPIALMQYERMIKQLGPNEDPPKIGIYRLAYNMDKVNKPSVSKKLHPRDDFLQKTLGFAPVAKKMNIDMHAVAIDTPADKPKKKRTFEYVDIALLYHVMRKCMEQCCPASVQSSCIDINRDSIS
jgi:hypothetical protein